jgi:hypothetical protein
LAGGDLIGERLVPLLRARPIALTVMLGPLTQFFDEDVTLKEARLLWERVLRTWPHLTSNGARALVAQTVPAHHTPRRWFARDLLRSVDVGLRLVPGDGRWSAQVVKPRP